jgi:hypothetical protein
MVDDRALSGCCDPESRSEADTLPHSKTAHSAIWTNIAPVLKARYEVPQDLPPEMFALLVQLNERREDE